MVVENHASRSRLFWPMQYKKIMTVMLLSELMITKLMFLHQAFLCLGVKCICDLL